MTSFLQANLVPHLPSSGAHAAKQASGSRTGAATFLGVSGSVSKRAAPFFAAFVRTFNAWLDRTQRGYVTAAGGWKSFRTLAASPLRSHRAHRADWHSLLLETSDPHRMINGTGMRGWHNGPATSRWSGATPARSRRSPHCVSSHDGRLLDELPVNAAVLDGEVVASNADGSPNFARLHVRWTSVTLQHPSSRGSAVGGRRS